MKPRMTSAFAFLTLAFTAAAFGDGVFYAVPNGAGDGSSWADAADLKTAYDAAAQAEGGEVWLKKGTHILAETVALASNVVVRGGFAGTEASADAADPEANFTLISGDANHDDVWYPDATTSSSKFVSLYDGEGGLVAVNPNRANLHWSAGESNSALTADDLAIGFTNGIAVSGAAFHGVTFASFQSAAVSISRGSFENYLFSNCRFVACNNRRTALAALFLKGSGAIGTINNCTFEGCYRAAWIANGNNTLRNSVVRECYFGNCSQSEKNSCVILDGSSPTLRAYDCVFEGNLGANKNSYAAATDIRLGASGGSATLTRCVFRNGLGTSLSGTKNVRAPVLQESGITLYANYCVFTNNVIDHGGQGAAGAIYSTGGRLFAKGCYIAGNVVTNTGSNASAGAIQFAGGQYESQVSDMTFERNAVYSTGSGHAGTLVVSGSSYLPLGIANCVIADNVVTKGPSATGRAGDLCQAQTSRGNTHTVLLNSVFSGCGPSGQLFFNAIDGVQPRLEMVNTVVHNYPVQTIGDDFATLDLDGVPVNAQGQLEVPMAVDPMLRPAAVVGPEGVPARGLKALSPFAKAARPVWLVGSHWWYSLNQNGSGNVSKATHYNTNKTKSAAGITASTPTPPDAFQRARNRNAFAYGPLRQEKTTTVFSVN